MRSKVPFLILFIISTWQVGLCQQKKINLHASSISLNEVLDTLESMYGVRFAYSPEILSQDSLEMTFANQPLQSVLEKLLQPHYLSFEIVSQDYIIIKNEREVLFRTVDKETGSGLPFATAQIISTGEVGVSDQFGLLSVRLQDSKNKSIAFRFLGYQEQIVRLDTVPYQDTLSIYLLPKVIALNELIIREYLNQGIFLNPSWSNISIQPNNMDILPGLAESDVLLTTQMLPGISSVDESASGITFRGSGPGQTIYFWNDIPVYSPAHYFGNISSFIPSSVKQIDVYKNYLPIDRTEASAGLFSLSAEADTLSHAGANLNLTHADMIVQSALPGDWGKLMVAGRRSFNDLMITPTYQSLSKKIFEGSTTSLLQNAVTENTFDFNNSINFSDINVVWDKSLRIMTI